MNEDIPTLVSNMIDRMKVISDVVGDIMKRKYSEAFDKLQDMINGWDDEDESAAAKMMLKDIRFLKGSLYAYCEQVPVLGFNSSNYDLNRIKGYIANYLRIDYETSVAWLLNRTIVIYVSQALKEHVICSLSLRAYDHFSQILYISNKYTIFINYI